MKLENTGERMIPQFHMDSNKYGAHIGRYQAGLQLVRGKNVLDIACGTGYGSQLMASEAKKVYGVDVSKDAVDYAKKKFPAKNLEYKVGDGTSIPLKDNSVDVVVSYETIEHIQDYKKFMSEVKRVLKPDGTLLLSTPNELESGDTNHYHFHEFTLKELKALVLKYFKYHKDYFQTLWLYNSILSEKLQTTKWESEVSTLNVARATPEQSVFFFMVCSNKKITTEIKPQGIISEHFRLHESPDRVIAKQQKELLFSKRRITKLEQRNEQLKRDVSTLQKKRDAIRSQLKAIHNSRTWKMMKLSGDVLGKVKRSRRG